MNSICLVGRLVRDPELRTTNSGKNVASFTIAVDKGRKPQNEGDPTADFFRCNAWNQTANFLCDYGSKGRMVSVTGRIECRKYEDKDGNPREAWEVTADNVRLLDKRQDGDDGGGSGGGQSTGGYNQTPRSQGGGGNQRPQSRPSSAASADEYDPFADE